VGCTDDSCDEVNDVVVHAPNNGLCDNGEFCDGSETCDVINDCQAGTPPVVDDGVGCTDDSCDEVNDVVVNAPNDSLCDNGDFCDGAETCDQVNDCQAGSDPCPGQACDEVNDVCVACLTDDDCSDGAFCNGAEVCTAGVCGPGTPVNVDDGVGCTDDSCDEVNDVVVNAPNDANCDNGQFCDGSETCDQVNDCQAGTDPCGGAACDEVNDICLPVGGDPVYWFSFRSNTSIPGVGTVTDDDIVSYDSGSGLWAKEFDGSDVGLSGFEISGMARLANGDLLMSFTAAGTIGGLSVDDSDIVQFTGTLGPNTSGTFSMYFDGSDVGLTSNGEDIDSIAFSAAGDLIISTTGGFSGTGASGADEDLFLFSGTTGPATSGSFTRIFDGSDVGLGGNGSADVDAAELNQAGTLLFSTVGSVTVGANWTDEDVVAFSGALVDPTSGSFSLDLDLSALGIAAGEDIGSMEIFE
jgi:hypothetical protein